MMRAHLRASQLSPPRSKGLRADVDVAKRTADENGVHVVVSADPGNGFPGFSSAAIDEVFNAGLIPQMFAEVVQNKEHRGVGPRHGL
jgi:hypothetical protein